MALHEYLFQLVAVGEEGGGSTVGSHDGTPVADVPRLVLGEGHLFGARVVAVRAYHWDVEHQHAVARGDGGAVAEGLFREGLLLLNCDAAVPS